MIACARSIVPVLMSSLLLAMGCEPGAGRRAEPVDRSNDPPHVLMIVVDTLRADHLGHQGYARDTSPTIDSLARDSLVFTNATAQAPHTIPSVLQLMTGRYLQTDAIPDDDPTIAQVMAERGYRTMAVIDNPVIETTRTELERGFSDFFRNAPIDPDLEQHHWKSKMPADVITRRAIRWWQSVPKDEPTFVWLHYFDPHDPYLPPFPQDLPFVDEHASSEWTGDIRSTHLASKKRPSKPFDEVDKQHLIDLYDAEIFYLDQSLADLFDFLRREGLYDDMLIVLLADHGESFGENGVWMHGRTVNQAQLHVPLLVKLPGEKQTHRVIDDPVQLVDVFPTLCEQLDLACPEGLGGRDLVGGTHEYAFVLWRRWVVVRDRRYKLISDERSGRALLFDLQVDPHETTNVAPQHAEVLARLQRVKQEWLDGLETSYDEAARESELQSKQLEALGYIE